MTNRHSLTWLWSSVDILIALLATVVCLVVIQGRHTASIGELLSVRITLKNLLLLGLFLVIWTGIHNVCGLHSHPKIPAQADLAAQTVLASLLGSVFFLFFPLTSTTFANIATPALTFFCAATTVSLLIRLLTWHSVSRLTRATAVPVKTLIVGSGPMAYQVYRSLLDADMPAQVLGFVDSTGDHTIAELRPQVIGTIEELEIILMTNAVDEVALALPVRSCYDQAQQVIAVCERVGTPTAYAYQPFRHQGGYSRVKDSKITCIRWRPTRDIESNLVKRSLDVFVGAAALLIFAPALLLIAVAIKLTSPGPIFFVQERHGLNKRKFKMYKFRTMVSDAEGRQGALEAENEAQGPVFKIKRDPRITPLGSFLRKTSLDELPQLFNVLKGEMSLVGPRPLPNRDVARFTGAWLMRRFSVKPGLTCLWQITGRSNTSFDEWIRLDLQYIDTLVSTPST